MNADGTSLSTSPRNTSYLTCAGRRIGYDIGGVGPLLVLVPGMGDLLAGYRFPAPALREAGYPGCLHRPARPRRQRRQTLRHPPWW
jgi:hypothetical protein